MAKLKFNVDDVLPRLSQVSGVVNAKSPLQILGNVVFVTRMGTDESERRFMLMTSDSETWLTVNVPFEEFDESMSFCVSAQDIVKVLSNLKGKTVEMTLDDETHTAKCSYGNGRFSLPFDATTDFPNPVMEMDGCHERAIVASELLYVIGKTRYAIANDKLRPILNGVHFDFMPSCMVAVATDGQKLAKYTDNAITHDGDEMVGFTLPEKPVNILASCLGGVDDEVSVVFNDKCVAFVCKGNFKLQTRLLEGNYPNYERVIPKDNAVETIVSRTELLDALKRVMPMGNEKSELVKLTFTMGNVTVATEDEAFSKSADENVGCDYASQEIAIGFNGTMLAEILQSIDDDNVRVCLKDPTRAGLFRPSTASETDDYVALLMPIFV